MSVSSMLICPSLHLPTHGAQACEKLWFLLGVEDGRFQGREVTIVAEPGPILPDTGLAT